MFQGMKVNILKHSLHLWIEYVYPPKIYILKPHPPR